MYIICCIKEKLEQAMKKRIIPFLKILPIFLAIIFPLPELVLDIISAIQIYVPFAIGCGFILILLWFIIIKTMSCLLTKEVIQE